MTRPLLAFLLVLVAPLAAAQTPDNPGCGEAQSTPCEWSMGVDSDGILTEAEANFTEGEWIRLTVTNVDSAPHTITIDGTSVSVQAAATDEATILFQAPTKGDHTVHDEPSGDTGILRVLAAGTDVVDAEQGHTSGQGGSTASGKAPGVEIYLLAVGIVAAAFLARRK